MDFSTELAGHTLEYIDDCHTYLVDGLIVPSVTQIIHHKFSNKYSHVPRATLNRAAAKGTAVHEAIQAYCENGTESDLPEVRNFKFLQKHYGFTVDGCEKPVILFDADGGPLCAGRFDLAISMDGMHGLADIKRTATLDKQYLAYQLNLYRIAYRQCYGIEAQFLRGVHLRESVRKFVEIPINEKMAMELVTQYILNTVFGGNEDE